MKNSRSTATVVPSQKSRLGTVIAKDGGWGWVVVFAAFMTYILSVGMLFSLGILTGEFATYFNESKGATAWVLSITVGVCDCVGPVVSGLTNRYGCRTVTIAGAILTCFGMLISLPAPNVLYLYFTFGPAIGIGVGMMFLPSVIIVNSYFESKRALATGISMSGSSVGTLLMSPMIEVILSYYGNWQSTLCLLAGIALNGAVFGSLYRAPDIWVLPADDYEEDEECGDGIVIFEPIPEEQERFLSRYSVEAKYLFTENKIRRTESEPSTAKNFVKIPIRRSHSLSDLEDLETPERLSITTTQSLLRRRQTYLRSNVDIAPSRLTTRRNRSVTSYGYLTQSQRTRDSRVSRARVTTSGLLYRKDIFYSASLLTVPEYRDNDPEYYESLVTSVIEIEEERKWYFLPTDIWYTVKEMMGLSLLKDRAYQVILLSRFVASLGLLVPYLYIADRAIDLGITGGSLLLSVISVGNMFGRLVIGIISDHKSVNRVLLYKMITAICGLMISTISFCYTFFTMAIVSAVFGFAVGAFSSILPIILVDVMGIAKLTNSYGLVMCFQGIASMLGLPITAVIYDATDSYVIGFLFSGALVTVSGFITCFIPFVAVAKQENERRRRPPPPIIQSDSVPRMFSST